MSARTSGLTLCHVPVSHYSEKARWALDYKRIPHVRRWPPGGLHPVAAFVLTRGAHQTVPVLVMDGEGVGDSTEIIRRLEERFPDPPLYPADAAKRQRALDLEEWCDEEIGPYVRRMVYHHLASDPDLLAELTAHQIQYGPPALSGLTKRGLKVFLNQRFSTGSVDAALAAEEKVNAGLDRLETELDGRKFLIGGRFSVADLTAAALLYPLILPPQAPWRPSRMPEAWTRLQAAHQGRPVYNYLADMYRRFR